MNRIYHISEARENYTEKRALKAESSALKIAAGGEDILSLSDEAVRIFRKKKDTERYGEYLRRLALDHINDDSQLLKGLEDDAEFVMAERLSLLAELVIRVAPTARDSRIYSRVSGFVMEQFQNK